MKAGTSKPLVKLRPILAALAVLTAAGFLFYARTDHIPRDRSARVTAQNFWAALARPVAAQRPTNIVVYPAHLGVQLVTCTGHPPTGPSVDKYLYVKLAPGDPSVQARLSAMGIAFGTPWWDATWLREAPWACLAFAAVLMLQPAFGELRRIMSDAKSAAPAQPSPPPPRVTAESLEKVRALDAAMESALASLAIDHRNPPPSTAAPAAASPAFIPKGAPLEAIAPPPQEDKEYRGEFYPVARPKSHDGFTLVELLVVIGILGVLIALLLPTLTGARQDANQIACAANLSSIGQGLTVYETENNGLIPASYSYNGQTVVNGQQQYTDMGYVHWSSFLYSNGTIPAKAFLCPELDQGGLPPTNTTDDNRLPGQISDTPGAIDQQTPRNAYTLNEALSPRNKFALGFQGAQRIYKLVQASSVPHPSSTILATEWGQNAARFTSAAQGAQFYLYSHRPVHGFVGLDGTLDMFQLSPNIGYRRVTATDLDPDPSTATTSTTRLDWVGRNHGHIEAYPDQRRTNFLYLDGHVECKTIYQTLSPFEWGDKFFTLVPNGDLQS